MHFLDYVLLVLATAVGLFVAGGGIVLTLPTPHYRAAKLAFWAAAICFGGLGILWGAFSTTYPLSVRIPAAGVTAAIAAMALTFMLSLLASHPESTTKPKTEFSEWTNVQLRERVRVVARDMRELERNYSSQRATLNGSRRSPSLKGEERNAAWRLENAELLKLDNELQEKFRDQFLSEGRSLRIEMLRRIPEIGNGMPGPYNRFAFGRNVIEHSIIAGPQPIAMAADYLEALSRTLP
jgi:hypothetical protein